MTRERLPNRRPTVTTGIRWPTDGGTKIHISAGLADDGRLLECFLRGGGRVGSERDHMLDDLAVVVSRLLQHGDQLGDIAAGLGRLPGGAPASVVGAILDVLVEVAGQQTHQPDAGTLAAAAPILVEAGAVTRT